MNVYDPSADPSEDVAPAPAAPRFSLGVLHAPWKLGRKEACEQLFEALATRDADMEQPTYRVFDENVNTDRARLPFVWASQWRWACETGATHHLFLTDDVHVAPRFWAILTAMVQARPRSVLGLMSNHPDAVSTLFAGHRWYRTNSWVVGPAYVVPHEYLCWFVDWYERLSPMQRRILGDDSALNDWITFGTGAPREAWHPVPTIIEHRDDVPSTHDGGKDHYGRERVSWRAIRGIADEIPRGGPKSMPPRWCSTPYAFDLEAMTSPRYWHDSGAPMLALPKY